MEKEGNIIIDMNKVKVVDMEKIRMAGIEVLKLLEKYKLNFYEEKELLFTLLKTMMVEDFLAGQNKESLLEFFEMVKKKNEKAD